VSFSIQAASHGVNGIVPINTAKVLFIWILTYSKLTFYLATPELVGVKKRISIFWKDNTP
jgi:hypothetical protein